MNCKNNNQRYWLIPLRFIAFIGIVSVIVMYLWNAIIPTVFSSVGTLTYYQAVGLLVLSKILFSGVPKRASCNKDFKQQSNMMNLTSEEREKLRQEWHNRCKK